MKLSQTSEMAIHGLWELALSDENERILVSEIARRHNVSESYLAKIFHRLGQAGIVSSRRGKIGGFMLARPADRISVGEIVRVFERDICPDGAREETASGKRSITREMALYNLLYDVKSRVYEVLDNVSLADLKRESPNSDSPKLKRRKYSRREGKA